MEGFDITALLQKVNTIDGYFAIITGVAATLAWVVIRTVATVAAKSTILAGRTFLKVDGWAIKRDKKIAVNFYWRAYKSPAGVEMLKYWFARNVIMSVFWIALIALILAKKTPEDMNVFEIIAVFFLISRCSASSWHVTMDFIMIPVAIQLRYMPHKLKGRARARRKLPPLQKLPAAPKTAARRTSRNSKQTPVS